MKNLNEILLTLAIVFAGLFLWRTLQPRIEKVETISIDTVSIVDTVTITKYKTVEKLKAVIDTVFIEDEYIEVAKADTILSEDSSRINIEYYFPPLNEFRVDFDLKEKVIEKVKTITQIKEVTIKEPFYKDEWFYSTLAAVLLLIVSLMGGK